VNFLPPPHLRDPGDQWVYGPNGEKVWGAFGAAGVLVWNRDTDCILLQLRAEWSHHGGTWGIPGGAMRKGESAREGALREAHEEAGVPEELLEAIDEFIIDLGFWSYTTVIARTTEHFEPVENDQESIDLQWVSRTAVEELELHPRFGQNWPHLRDLLAGHIE
jgi:8-oxo-dGTP pyrophosphatase MutT (NUDIX family)